MKNFFTRHLALFILIIYIISLFPVVLSAEDGYVLEYDFEAENSADLWIGALRDSNCAYNSNWGIQVSNPYGDQSFDTFDHILEYNDIRLEEGKFYTFSAYVMNPMAEEDSIPEAKAYIGRGGNALFIDVASIGYEWNLVTASFIATENINLSLIVTLQGGDLDMGFFMDDISIVPDERTPDYVVLEGPDSVFIPHQGASDYRYSLVVYDTDDSPVDILLTDPQIDVDSIPEGVEFDESSGSLNVLSSAEPNKTFTLTYTALIGNKTRVVTKEITTTKNLLSDPGFENGEENWTSDEDISYDDGLVSLYASQKGDWGYYASATYSKQLLLFAGNMYVFRANVGSEDEYSASSVYISNLSFAQSGYAEINITGVGSEWSEVTSAFVVEHTGLYDLTINLYATSQRPIYMDDVYLAMEDETYTSISIHAPGHIQAPSDLVTLPCYATVRNQLGEVMEGSEPRVTIIPDDEGVYLEDDKVIVPQNATRGDYIIKATFEDLVSTHTITVSDHMVGDGGFEEKEANVWWTSSDGSVFSIIDYDGDMAAHVYSSESSCVVINNSYMELTEGEYYVYSASAGYGEGKVTAFISDAETGEFIPFAQYDPLYDTKVPFSMDRTIVGRLVLYIESESSVGLIFDDIAITPSVLTVADVLVTGGDYGDFLRGSYVYINNMTDDANADISSTRWYISSTYDGQYQPIGVPNQSYLEFTPDMAGQYIIYEVTPICAHTGLWGESVRSLPVEISHQSDSDDKTERPVSEMKPVELDNIKEHPFTDITAHWAENIIASLSNAGIVSGRTATKFSPESRVTRAEFTAMAARAFSLVSIPYSGDFSDVNVTDWHAGWVEAAYKRGIIQGTSEKTFSPDDYITREQMATILIRAYNLCKGPLPYDLPLRYYDSYLINSWAYDSVKTGTNLNIFTGNDMNLFRPQEQATRAEAAAVIYRTLKCFN